MYDIHNIRHSSGRSINVLKFRTLSNESLVIKAGNQKSKQVAAIGRTIFVA